MSPHTDFQVVHHPDKGQCLVATRQIKPLEIILSERPAVLGPYSRPNQHQCLECFKLIYKEEKGKDFTLKYFKLKIRLKASTKIGDHLAIW